MQTPFVALSDDDLRRLTPSVFATEAHPCTSERYAFIPTINVVQALREEGFFPVRALQSRTRDASRHDFTQHMLRFRNVTDKAMMMVGDEVPEIVLVNSHDLSSGYELMAGIFRLICSNGMVVQSANFGSIKIRHQGDIAGQVIEGSYRIIEEIPQIMATKEQWEQIRLPQDQRLQYAAKALQLKYPEVAPIQPVDLLRIRRPEDARFDLWHTFNMVQENMLRGGLVGHSASGRRSRTRGIQSVHEEQRINKALWSLTEQTLLEAA